MSNMRLENCRVIILCYFFLNKIRYKKKIINIIFQELTKNFNVNLIISFLNSNKITLIFLFVIIK